MESLSPSRQPSTISLATLLFKKAVAFLVKVDVGEKAERFNITARRSQMEEIDRLAEREGMTRSAYMVRSALATKPVPGRQRPQDAVEAVSRTLSPPAH